MNDIDIEQARMYETAAFMDAQKKKGNCPHGWQGPLVEGEPGGKMQCYDCGKVFSSSQEGLDAYSEWIIENL